MLNFSPKNNSIALGATKTPFKKKFNHHKSKDSKSSSTFKKYEKKGNNNGNFKQENDKARSSNPKPKEKFDGNCNFCGIFGHKEYDCRKKKYAEKGKRNANVKNFNNKKKNKHAASVAYYSVTQTISNDWIVDSGCTNHMCYEKNKFENFHKYKKDAVVIGDNSILDVQEIGSVKIHGNVLDNVFYVPKLRMNLISVIQITRKGYSFEFTSHS